MTIRTTLIALSALGLTAIATVPASADSLTLRFSDHGTGIALTSGYGHGPRFEGHRPDGRHEMRDRISVREAYRTLRFSGFERARLVEETRHAYVFHARGHRGPVKVWVSARSGDIVEVRRAWR